jgi:hypothetical protein
MAFKIKDLMIGVLPGGGPMPQPACRTAYSTHLAECQTGYLTYVINCRTAYSTHLTATPVIQCTVTFGDPVEIDIESAERAKEYSLAHLAILKEQLQRRLAEVQKLEAEIEESMQPKTVEEIDMLTEKLHGALEELKTRKDDLKKKSDSARDK